MFRTDFPFTAKLYIKKRSCNIQSPMTARYISQTFIDIYWKLVLYNFILCSSSCVSPPATDQWGVGSRKGCGQGGGRADGLHPFPARIHLCGRWDSILHPHYCTSSCKTSPSICANPWSSADIYNNEARASLALWSLKLLHCVSTSCSAVILHLHALLLHYLY